MKHNKDLVVAAVWFSNKESPRRQKYLAWADVWQYSANRVFYNVADIIYQEQDPPDMTEPCPIFWRGTRKIGPSKTLAFRKKVRSWNAIVKSVPIGTPILLTDIDVAFFSNPFPRVLEDVIGWDVGRTGHNTGTIYLSGSEESHIFMQRWEDTTEEMFHKKALYQTYDKKYKGLDQGSFGLLLERGNHPARFVTLPARFHSTYVNNEVPCYIMHYHSVMSSAIFGNKKISTLKPEMQTYAYAWLEMLERARSDGE